MHNNEYVWTDEDFIKHQLKNNSSTLSPEQKMKMQVLANSRIEEIVAPFLERFVNAAPEVFVEERWNKYRDRHYLKRILQTFWTRSSFLGISTPLQKSLLEWLIWLSKAV